MNEWMAIVRMGYCQSKVMIDHIMNVKSGHLNRAPCKPVWWENGLSIIVTPIKNNFFILNFLESQLELILGNDNLKQQALLLLVFISCPSLSILIGFLS